MRTCSLCNETSADTAQACHGCGSDLDRHSVTAITLTRLRDNPRVSRIRLMVSDDSCPACKAAEGDFAKKDTPNLPVAGCSHSLGCRCFYEPKLTQVYP